MSAHGTGICWRCKTAQANYLHIWWSCVEIFNFCSQIHNCIEERAKGKLPMNPNVMLLLDFEYGGVVIFKVLLAYLLTAATLSVNTKALESSGKNDNN